MAQRGMLTQEAKDTSKELLGYEITQNELRLMPYIQYIMMNSQRLDPNKIDPKEREILSEWRKKKFIEGGASGLTISRQFWDSINAILWLTYVNID